MKEFNKNLEIFRFVNQADPVPHLPPRYKTTLKKYYNIGHEIFIKSAIEIIKNNSSYFQQLEIVTCEGDGVGCSLNAFGSKFIVDNHLQYPSIIFSSRKSCQDIIDANPYFIDQQNTKNQRQNLEQWVTKVVCQTSKIPTPPQLHCDQKKHPLLEAIKKLYCGGHRPKADLKKKFKNQNEELDNDEEIQESSSEEL